MNLRFASCAAVLLMLLPVAAPAEETTIREESRQVVEARGLTGVRVDNPRGLIRVSPSADGRIHVVALKLSTGRVTQRLRDFARDTRVETSTTGGRYHIVVRYPQHQVIHASWGQFFRGEVDLPRVSVRLGLEVPPGLALELDTASGDVETAGIKGAQSLQTTSGDIEVRNAGMELGLASTSGDVNATGFGRATVRGVSGNVTLRDARGPIVVSTTSGDVEVQGAADSVSVRCVSGEVRIDQAPRGLNVATTSGDVTVDGEAGGGVLLRSTSGSFELGLARGARRLEASTGSGDITVRVASGLGCDLVLSSTSGTLDCALPLRVRNMTRHQVSGVVGDGRAALILKTISGDIDVSGGGR
jgi:hypothetical protein